MAPDELAWRYHVHLEALRDLTVDARFGPTADGPFGVDKDATPFLTQVELAQGAAWAAVPAQGGAWLVPCRTGCRVRYRFALREAALTLSDADTAIASGDALIAPPSTWLLHPESTPGAARLEFQVEPGLGASFASAFKPTADERPNSYVAPASSLDDASFAAFGAFQVLAVQAGDTTLQLAVAPQGLGLSEGEARAWVSASAGAVANFYQGHLPAQRTLIVLMKGTSESTRGETLGGGGPAVLVRAGSGVTAATTRDDWIVTHELLHANFPDLGRDHAWLSEGLATYLEPIARARVGLVSEDKVWGDLLQGLPQGLPAAGDQGLELTHTWGRTYWGGALYCLLADLTIRERTSNRRSLDDVLLAIGKTGAADETFWELSQVLDAGERATGTPVLRELYEQLALTPKTVDLPAIFGRLGVKSDHGSLVFDDTAPLATIRRSITARRPGGA